MQVGESMSETQPLPWQQQEGEPNRAFEHFLYYLCSPRPRKLLKAYRGFNPDTSDGAGLPDAWQKEFKRWHWDDRALAWDVDQISRHGQKAVVNMVHAIEMLTDRVMEAIGTMRGETWSYAETMNAIKLLGELIPAETVAALRDTARSGDTPAIGSKPVTINTIVADFTAIAPGSMGNREPSGEVESGVQRAALGQNDDGWIVVDSRSGTGREGTVDSTDIQEHAPTVALG